MNIHFEQLSIKNQIVTSQKKKKQAGVICSLNIV